MAQMRFAEFLVSVSSRCDVEVSLHFVSVQAAEDSARIWYALNSWCLAELPLLRLAQLLMYIPQLLPARVDSVVFAQLVHSLLHLPASPLRPVRRIVAKEVAS
jgi:hypothetical protein